MKWKRCFLHFKLSQAIYNMLDGWWPGLLTLFIILDVFDTYKQDRQRRHNETTKHFFAFKNDSYFHPVFRQLKGCSKYWSGAGVVQLQCSFWAIILKWTRYNIEFNDPLKYKLCSSDILQNAAASLQDNPFCCTDTFCTNFGFVLFKN